MKNFTRGGQIFSHGFRMTKQVLKTAALVSLMVWLLWFSYEAYTTELHQKVLWALTGFLAEIKLGMAALFPSSKTPLVSFYDFTNERWISLKASTFLKSPFYHDAIRAFLNYEPLLFKSLLVYGSTFVLVTVYFMRRGLKNSAKSILRGGQLVSAQKLRGLLKRERKASRLAIGDIPLVKNTETQHILLCGTSGSGKTTWMHQLMPEIRRSKQKAVIVDVVGSFVERYFRPGHDIILNPFDSRSAYWTPWADITSDASYESITSAMTSMNQTSSSQAGIFFDATASILLKSLLKKLKAEGRTSNRLLYEIISEASPKVLETYLKGTGGALLASPQGKETMMSIRSTLLMKLEALSHLEDKTEEPFSISRFMSEAGDRCLFLSLPKAEHIEPLKNLVATWINIAILSLMNQPEDLKRRCWFLIDELPALGKIPSLTDAVTRIRKYGGCVVASIQNLSQLDSVYGYQDRETLTGNFNTKAIFRATNTTTAEYFSKILGQTEQRRIQENISYGAHEMRDGISLNELERIENIVLPSELTTLKDRECFVKLPGAYPVAKTTVPLQWDKASVPSFIPKEIV